MRVVITISGPPKRGKTWIAMSIMNTLKQLFGAKVTNEDIDYSDKLHAARQEMFQNQRELVRGVLRGAEVVLRTETVDS